MSVFLEIPEAAWVAANDLAFAFRSDWFSATTDERTAILALVEVVKKQLDEELHPDGYNVGFNAGEAAGQTVMHLHVHVIPRFKGDMDDPRGGVRHVIPSRGNYLREVAPLATGGQDDPFARHVLPLFERADDIAIVAAFVQASGLGRIREATELALRRGAQIRILTMTPGPGYGDNDIIHMTDGAPRINVPGTNEHFPQLFTRWLGEEAHWEELRV